MKKRWGLPILIIFVLATALGTAYSLYADDLLSLFKNVPASVTVRVIKEEGLTVTKIGSPNPVELSELITYELTVRNDSSAPSTNVVLTDHLPFNVEFVSATSTAATIEQDGNTITFDFGDLLPGESATGFIVVSAVGSGTVENTAVVESRELASRAATDQITVQSIATPTPTSNSGGGSAPRIAPVIAYSPESVTFNAVEDGANPDPQILSVSNSKSRSELSFTVESTTDWLDVDPSEGFSEASNDRERISLSVDISDMNAGTYEGTVIISARRAANDPQSVPVDLIILPAPEPGVISRARASVEMNRRLEISTDDGRIQVNIPEGAITDDGNDDDRVVEVEVKIIEIDSVPAPDGETIFIRAIELNTLIDGELSPIDYAEPVELVFVLTQEDLDAVEGETSRLGVLWFNEDADEWESIPVEYEPEPAPAGQLVTLLSHFSVYAVAIMEKEAPQAPEVQVVPTRTSSPTPQPSPTPTSSPAPLPTRTATSVPTAAQATPTAIVIAQVAVPSSTATPRPTTTATVAPPAPVPAIPLAPALTVLPASPPDDLSSSGRSVIELPSAVRFLIIGIAIVVVFAVVLQGLRIRRREP